MEKDSTSCKRILVKMEEQILKYVTKSTKVKRFVKKKVGDIVLLKTNNTHRDKWPMVQVTEKMPDKDGLVRSVKL